MEKNDTSHAKWDAQLRKGTLELVIMAALQKGAKFGLELLGFLRDYETMIISEGTLYPLLDRLKREGLIDANWQQEDNTRPRKYYELTSEGKNRLTELTSRWRQSVRDIETLLNAK